MAFQSIFQSAGYQRENVKTIIQPDQRTKVSSKVEIKQDLVFKEYYTGFNDFKVHGAV